MRHCIFWQNSTLHMPLKFRESIIMKRIRTSIVQINKVTKKNTYYSSEAGNKIISLIKNNPNCKYIKESYGINSGAIGVMLNPKCEVHDGVFMIVVEPRFTPQFQWILDDIVSGKLVLPLSMFCNTNKDAETGMVTPDVPSISEVSSYVSDASQATFTRYAEEPSTAGRALARAHAN